MPTLDRVYLISAAVGAAEGEGTFTSLARDPEQPGRLLAFATAHEAGFEEAYGTPFVPGYVFGEQSIAPLSTLAKEKLVLALRELFGSEMSVYGPCDGFDEHVNVWPGDVDPIDFAAWPRGRVTTLMGLFDRCHDLAVVGRRQVLAVTLTPEQ